jgi:DNA-directed RNA polymerase subunit RPC12/RpoP
VRCSICTKEFEAAQDSGDRPSRTAYAVALTSYLCVECRAEWQASGEFLRSYRAEEPAAVAARVAGIDDTNDLDGDEEPPPSLIGRCVVSLEDFIRRRIAERRNS